MLYLQLVTLVINIKLHPASQQDNFINPEVGLNDDKENLPCPVPCSAPAEILR